MRAKRSKHVDWCAIVVVIVKLTRKKELLRRCIRKVCVLFMQIVYYSPYFFFTAEANWFSLCCLLSNWIFDGFAYSAHKSQNEIQSAYELIFNCIELRIIHINIVLIVKCPRGGWHRAKCMFSKDLVLRWHSTVRPITRRKMR